MPFIAPFWGLLFRHKSPSDNEFNIGRGGSNKTGSVKFSTNERNRQWLAKGWNGQRTGKSAPSAFASTGLEIRSSRSALGDLTVYKICEPSMAD